MRNVAESAETRIAKRLLYEAKQISASLEGRQSNQAGSLWDVGSPEYTAFHLGRMITLERLAGKFHDEIDTKTKTSLLRSIETCRALLRALPKTEGILAPKRLKPTTNVSGKPTLLWRIAEGEKFKDEFGRVFRNCGSFQKLLECPAEVPMAYHSEFGTQFHLSGAQRVFRL